MHHKNRWKHNQHFQLLFSEINIHSGLSYQTSSYEKLILTSHKAVFNWFSILKKFKEDSYRRRYIGTEGTETMVNTFNVLYFFSLIIYFYLFLPLLFSCCNMFLKYPTKGTKFKKFCSVILEIWGSNISLPVRNHIYHYLLIKLIKP